MSDHWYRLSYRKTEYGLAFPGATVIEEPLTKSEMFFRIRQIINCEAGPDESIAHSATACRVDASSRAVTWEQEIGVDLNRLTRLHSAKIIVEFDDEQSTPASTASNNSSPIVGFRTWALNVPSVLIGEDLFDGEPQLFGPNWYGRSERWEWTAAEVTAHCLHKAHQPPVKKCSCGLYAYHSHFLTFEDADPLSRGTYVNGAVLGAGDVLIHHQGWRAQAARIIGFSRDGVDHRFLPSLRELASKFDVPIVSNAELHDLATSKGRVIRKSDVESPDLG